MCANMPFSTSFPFGGNLFAPFTCKAREWKIFRHLGNVKWCGINYVSSAIKCVSYFSSSFYSIPHSFSQLPCRFLRARERFEMTWAFIPFAPLNFNFLLYEGLFVNEGWGSQYYTAISMGALREAFYDFTRNWDYHEFDMSPESFPRYEHKHFGLLLPSASHQTSQNECFICRVGYIILTRNRYISSSLPLRS